MLDLYRYISAVALIGAIPATYWLNSMLIRKIRLKGFFGFILVLAIALVVNALCIGFFLFIITSGGSDSGPIIAAFGTVLIVPVVAINTAVSNLHYTKTRGKSSKS